MNPPLDVWQTADGSVRFRVRVSPGAKREAVGGVHGGALKIAVRAVAEKGKANTAVVAALAGRMGIKPADVTIVAGHAARIKTIEISGGSIESVLRSIGE